MSDINNKHLPTDADKLTRKDLVELFHIQMEENQKLLKQLDEIAGELETTRHIARSNGNQAATLLAEKTVAGLTGNDINKTIQQLKAQVAELEEFKAHFSEIIKSEFGCESISQVVTNFKELERERDEAKSKCERFEIESLVLMGRYGDNWYDGFVAAWKEQRDSAFGGIDDYSIDDILKMSEDAESEYLSKAMSNEPEKLIARRDLEQQIKALEGALKNYVTAKFYPTTYAIQAFNDGVNHLYFHIQEKIEQLRKGVCDESLER